LIFKQRYTLYEQRKYSSIALLLKRTAYTVEYANSYFTADTVIVSMPHTMIFLSCRLL